MFIERDEIIPVQVESDEFYDDEPGPPKLTKGVQVKRDSTWQETAVYRLREFVDFLLIFYYRKSTNVNEFNHD
jgi:hypothetical protein